MDIITFLKSLTAGEATLVLVGILSLVQITPIRGLRFLSGSGG